MSLSGGNIWRDKNKRQWLTIDRNIPKFLSKKLDKIYFLRKKIELRSTIKYIILNHKAILKIEYSKPTSLEF